MTPRITTLYYYTDCSSYAAYPSLAASLDAPNRVRIEQKSLVLTNTLAYYEEMDGSTTLSIKAYFATLSLNDIQHNYLPLW